MQNFTLGGYAGFGIGPFSTNASSAAELKGDFLGYNANTPQGSGSIGYDPFTNVGILSLTKGPSKGYSVSGYPTTTTDTWDAPW